MSTRTLFAEVFKDEHRTIRDLLFDLVQAFHSRDLPGVHFFVSNLVDLGGPHFRYEEETLYPALLEVQEERIHRCFEEQVAAPGPIPAQTCSSAALRDYRRLRSMPAMR